MLLKADLSTDEIIISSKVFDTKVVKKEGNNLCSYKNQLWYYDNGELAYSGRKRIWVYRLKKAS